MEVYFSATAVAAAGVLALAASAVSANESWQNGFELRAGYMISDNDTTIELSGPENKGQIDIEDALELDEDTDSGRFGLSWRFKDRHEISVDAYRVHRTGNNSANTDFSFTTDKGNFIEVGAGAGIDTEINFDIYDISYGYSFIGTDRHHLAVVGGLYWMDMEVALEASASGQIKINGEELKPGDASVSSRSEISAPMPLLGLLYGYAVTPQWTLDVEARYFAITVDPYSGSILNLNLQATYNFEHLYVGGGFTWVNINVDIEDGDWNGGLDWDFSGPHVFIGTRF